jgi:hypothetical protein
MCRNGDTQPDDLKSALLTNKNFFDALGLGITNITVRYSKINNCKMLP